MIGETYTLEQSPDGSQYAFISTGPKGMIIKMVKYTWMHDDVYNLGFGDYKDGKLSDSIISNNSDLLKVMNTIALTVYLYTEKFPKRSIYVQPVDGKRSNLYRHIFRRRFGEIKISFEVKGWTGKKWVDYDPKNRYFAFEIKRL